METKLDFKGDIKCEAFSFRHGLYRYLTDERYSEFGYTIKLNNIDQSTFVHLEDFDEAVETCLNHFDRFDKVKEIAQARINYLSSPEGAWGRSGT